MFSRQIEQLARQADAERPTGSLAVQPPAGGRVPRQTIRSQTGWALVSVGLRLAAPGTR
jgi:hypothetical protein